MIASSVTRLRLSILRSRTASVHDVTFADPLPKTRSSLRLSAASVITHQVGDPGLAHRGAEAPNRGDTSLRIATPVLPLGPQYYRNIVLRRADHPRSRNAGVRKWPVRHLRRKLPSQVVAMPVARAEFVD